MLGFPSPSHISTHTPLARRDADGGGKVDTIFKFLLTRLSRGVTKVSETVFWIFLISTHTPLARRDVSKITVSPF